MLVAVSCFAAAPALRCAYFEVPERWNAPEARAIRLRAVIFPAAEPNPDKKALFHIEGGPGISPVDAGAKFYATDGKGYWKTKPARSIHPVSRDINVHGNDLVIGTHGRAFWILDNITPLRQFNPGITQSDGWLYAQVRIGLIN